MNDGRYVYETKRQGRIAHHHTDATVPHIVALLGSTFHAAKIGRLFQTSKYFRIFLVICSYLWVLEHPPLIQRLLAKQERRKERDKIIKQHIITIPRSLKHLLQGFFLRQIY